MRKKILCEKCNAYSECEYYCDTCGKLLDTVPITISFSYGHFLDGEEYEFCSDKCLIEFINKQKVNDRKKYLEFG